MPGIASSPEKRTPRIAQDAFGKVETTYDASEFVNLRGSLGALRAWTPERPAPGQSRGERRADTIHVRRRVTLTTSPSESVESSTVERPTVHQLTVSPLQLMPCRAHDRLRPRDRIAFDDASSDTRGLDDAKPFAARSRHRSAADSGQGDYLSPGAPGDRSARDEGESSPWAPGDRRQADLPGHRIGTGWIGPQ